MPASQAVGRADLVRVFRSMTRQLLLFEYREEDATPSKVARKLGLPLNLVSYHTNVLARAGCIELVGTRRVRGAVEHTYRTVDGSPISDHEWASLRPKVRRALSRLLVEALSRDAFRSLDGGGMDRATTHLTRNRVLLDAQGRDELSALLRSTVEAVERIQASARERAGELEAVAVQLLAFDEPTRR
jgi:hypothetical protein